MWRQRSVIFKNEYNIDYINANDDDDDADDDDEYIAIYSSRITSIL